MNRRRLVAAAGMGAIVVALARPAAAANAVEVSAAEEIKALEDVGEVEAPEAEDAEEVFWEAEAEGVEEDLERIEAEDGDEALWEIEVEDGGEASGEIEAEDGGEASGKVEAEDEEEVVEDVVAADAANGAGPFAEADEAGQAVPQSDTGSQGTLYEEAGAPPSMAAVGSEGPANTAAGVLDGGEQDKGVQKEAPSDSVEPETGTQALEDTMGEASPAAGEQPAAGQAEEEVDDTEKLWEDAVVEYEENVDRDMASFSLTIQLTP